MRAIVTVFKVELSNRESLLDSIRDMSTEIGEVAGAYTISPKPGKLFELLNLLKMSNISYGTHFNVSDFRQSSEI